MRRAAVVLAAATLGAACVPQPPAPALPSGVGVAWVRDTDGAPDANGNYREAYSRFQVLDGVTSGPEAITTPGYVPVTPLLGALMASFGQPYFPDGTARFPWNGFAGEGITTAVSTVPDPFGSTTNYDVTGPGGTCRFSNVSTTYATIRTLVVSPSPDGTRLVVFSRLNDSDASAINTYLSIYSLESGCPRISGVNYRRSSYAGTFSGEAIASPLAIWAPDSSAVLYPLEGAISSDGAKVMRLDATTGALPTVVTEQPGAAIAPMGWSTAGRILVHRLRSTGTPPVATATIETVPVTGGAAKVIDIVTAAAVPTRFEFHVGYFVPGTQEVLYLGGPRKATNSNGRVVSWPQISLFDDATGAAAVVAGTDSPLVWHDTPSGPMPNAQSIEAFVH